MNARPYNDACDPAAERELDARTRQDEVHGGTTDVPNTDEARARSEAEASRRAAIMLGLCAECWGDLVTGPGGVLTCPDPTCTNGPNGGLEP